MPTARWWSRFSRLAVSPELSTSRIVYVNTRPVSAGAPLSDYSTNAIRTSKYTLWTFLPRNLFEQFSRIANLYFVLIVLLQSFPVIRTTSPVLAAMPVVVIVSITAIKDAIEDWKRHISDSSINDTIAHTLDRWCNVNYATHTMHWWRQRRRTIPASQSLALHPIPKRQKSATSLSRKQSFTLTSLPNASWKETCWSDVRVGDFLLLHEGESVPADMVLLSTSEKNNTCNVETKNLDGETNLKLRFGVPELSHINTAHDCESIQFAIETEVPNVNLYTYRGNLIASPNAFDVDNNTQEKCESTPGATITSSTGAQIPIVDNLEVNNRQLETTSADPTISSSPSLSLTPAGQPLVSIALGPDNLLLRGCVLRNTHWAIGVVVYTGKETKIILNSGDTPCKRSRIDRMMNPHIMLNFFILFVMCATCSIATALFDNMYSYHGFTSAELYEATKPSKIELSVVTFFTCIVVFQNIVPISLYITIEIVKTVQAYFIYCDEDMRYSKTGSTCIPKTWNIADDLGQIEYIFSDKTGTLTQNVMEFRRCAIGGVTYGMSTLNTGVRDSIVLNSKLHLAGQSMYALQNQYGAVNPFADPTPSFADPLLVRHLHGVDMPSPQQSSLIREFFTLLATCHTVLADIEQPYAMPVGSSLSASALFNHPLNNTDNVPNASGSVNFRLNKLAHFSSPTVIPISSSQISPDVLPSHDYAQRALVSLSRTAPVLTKVIYRAQSPDEAALVSAARDVGFVFLEREASNVLVSILGQYMRFELLHVLEFNSTRKRMSVILRRTPVNEKSDHARKEAEGEVVLYCKGADNVILARLADGQSAQAACTLEQMEDFANEGYRTLCLGYRMLKEDEYQYFARRYREAATTIEDRDAKMAMVAESIECNLVFLGATAIEDKLQDGVPETIETLSQAGIKIWMLTGDKMETAINIGFSCNLLTRDMTLLIIRGTTAAAIRTQLTESLQSVQTPAKAPIMCHDENQIQSAIGHNANDNHHDGIRIGYALIIDGDSLKWALDEQCRKLFLELCIKCRSVVCCRVSPLQKAQVIAMVHQGLNVMSLAIGDGANDVSMIQEADVGVGIAGEEGLQASMASDYAIGQFRFLTKLVLVHGRWNYMRVAGTILNFLYKNMVWVYSMFVYQWFAVFSGDLMHDYTFLMFFNTIFTFGPAIMLGVFDRDIPPELALTYPQLHREGIKQTRYTSRVFSLYTLEATFQAFVCFFLTMPSYRGSAHPEGYNASKNDMTATVGVSVVFVVNLFVGLNLHSWIVLTHIIVWFSATSLLMYIPLYAEIHTGALRGFSYILYAEPTFFFTVILCVTVSLLPRFVGKFIQQTYFPNDADIVYERHRFGMDVASTSHVPLRSIKKQSNGQTSEPGLMTSKSKAGDLESLLSLTTQHSSDVPEKSTISPVEPISLNTGAPLDVRDSTSTNSSTIPNNRTSASFKGLSTDHSVFSNTMASTSLTSRQTAVMEDICTQCDEEHIGVATCRRSNASLNNSRHGSIIYHADSRTSEPNTGFAFSQEAGMSEAVNSTDSINHPHIVTRRRSLIMASMAPRISGRQSTNPASTSAHTSKNSLSSMMVLEEETGQSPTTSSHDADAMESDCSNLLTKEISIPALASQQPRWTESSTSLSLPNQYTKQASPSLYERSSTANNHMSATIDTNTISALFPSASNPLTSSAPSLPSYITGSQPESTTINASRSTHSIHPAALFSPLPTTAHTITTTTNLSQSMLPTSGGSSRFTSLGRRNSLAAFPQLLDDRDRDLQSSTTSLDRDNKKKKLE